MAWLVLFGLGSGLGLAWACIGIALGLALASLGLGSGLAGDLMWLGLGLAVFVGAGAGTIREAYSHTSLYASRCSLHRPIS